MSKTNNFLLLQMYKVEFVSDSEGNNVGRETAETEPIYINTKHILSLKENKLEDGTYDTYVFVNDFSEPVHVKEDVGYILDLIDEEDEDEEG